MTTTCNKGFGLIEMLVVLAVLSILITIAAPTFADIIDARRLQAALHAVHAHVQQARSDAIKRNSAIAISYFTPPDGSWRIGYRIDSPCNPAQEDPEASDACAIEFSNERTLTVLGSDRFPSVALRANRILTRFEPVHGTAMGTNVTLVLTTERGAEARVIVSNIGRIRICSPAGIRKLVIYSNC
jgi:type IV fimbrial biogenesis protein FimT